MCLWALQSVHIDILVPGPHIGSGNTPKKTEKKKPSGEPERRIPLQDGEKNRSHVNRRNSMCLSFPYN